MAGITQRKARTIIRTALAFAREHDLKPLAVSVIDAGGHLKAFEREDGASNYRFQISHGKASGAVGMGLGSRTLHARAETQSYFLAAVGSLTGTAVVPVPGGVLVLDRKGVILGAVGISGDVSAKDEEAAIAGIEAAGFVADPG